MMMLTAVIFWVSCSLFILSSVNVANAQRNGDLRLAQGSFSSSSYTAGRLEIYINGQWGTVCDDSFGSTDASVACRQMGFSSGTTSFTSYGSGSGQIWLDDVGCFGSESCLLSCSNRGIGSHNCLHSEDVAISCSGTRVSSTDCSFISTPTAITLPTSVSGFVNNIVGIAVGVSVAAFVLFVVVPIVICVVVACCVAGGVGAAASSSRRPRTVVTSTPAPAATTATVVTTGTQQAAYPQTAYPQTGYPQTAYPQPAYPQTAYPQSYPQSYPAAGTDQKAPPPAYTAQPTEMSAYPPQPQGGYPPQ